VGNRKELHVLVHTAPWLSGGHNGRECNIEMETALC